MRKFPLSFILILAILTYFAGLIFTHHIANNYFIHELKGDQDVIENKLENPALLGDSAGVINALFSALILGGAIYTLNLQRKEIDVNQKNNSLDKFETKFYEMIHLHKQNVDEMVVDNLKGRRAIEELYKKLSVIYSKVENAIVELENINRNGDANEIVRFTRIQDYLSNPTDKLLFIHQLSYGYFFYGIENYHITKDNTNVRFELNADITTILILRQEQLTPANSLLGHYFRHLYQTVQLVANEEIIKEEKKNQYTKLIRAQLSDFEQALLYYNSLSVMGTKWSTPIGEKSIEKMCLIARFRLIKNIPYYIEYFGINPSKQFQVEKEVWEQKGYDFFELAIS